MKTRLKRTAALAVFVVVAALVVCSDAARGQLPANVHLGAFVQLPDSVRESWLGGQLTIEVTRSARDTAERRMIEMAERLFPARATIEREVRQIDGSGNVRAFARAATLPGDRWWTREWDGVLLPYAITGATVQDYLTRMRAMPVDTGWFARVIAAGTFRANFQYHADVERSGEPGARFRVRMSMHYSMYCGKLCAMVFDKERTVEFDAHGQPTKVTGDGQPEMMVS